MTNRVLLIGGSGYVGQYLARDLQAYLGPDYHVYSSYLTHNVFTEGKATFPDVVESFHIDLSDSQESAIAVIRSLRPEFIVNTAAMSAVPDCQNNPEKAYRVNDPSDIASVAMQNGCKRFIHFSTDMVYRGSQGPYSEDDEASPVSTMVYGLSKRKGEERLLATVPATILRSALVIGKPPVSGVGRGSTLEWMKVALEKATPDNPAGFFSNEMRSPILVDDIVRVVGAVINRHKDLPDGLVLNMGGDTGCSRYDIGMGLANRMGIAEDRMRATLQEPIMGGIERPRDIRMTNDKLKGLLGIGLCGLDESLDFIFGIKPHPYNTK
jgi:dTDP-4-dehydrorhamnose reductase